MEKPIRILHVLQRMEAGGTQALLMNLYRKIDKSKIQFDFLVEYPDKQFYDEEVIKLGGKIFYTNVRNDFNIFRFQKILKKIILENNYKIIHVHAYTIGFFALQVAKNCKVPVRIAHSHSNNMTQDWKKYLKMLMQKLFLINATDFMACSMEAGKYLFKNKKFEVLNNAIDSEKFVYNAKISEKIKKDLKLEKNFIVGHVGRFKAEKNHKFLIEVFKKIKKIKSNAKLLLIGDGPLKKEIQLLVNKENIKNDVIFLGNCSNVNELLQVMDIFIFPSLYEGLGIVAIESQAAGTPILISNGVPNEANITPICKKIKLTDSPIKWANEAINISKSKLAHTNMQKYIIKSGFDMQSTVNWLEEFYLSSIKSE